MRVSEGGQVCVSMCGSLREGIREHEYVNVKDTRALESESLLV